MAFTKVRGPGIHTLSDITNRNINCSGIITASSFVGPLTASSGSSGTFDSLTITGAVSIGGTLTYEDVKNIDSVGIITARSNIDAQKDVLVGAGLSVVGISTFTGVVDINGGGRANTFKVEDLTDNRVVIAGTGGELEDDANLTFSGTKLAVGVELDVDGQTTLDHVNVAGVSTFAGEVDIANGQFLDFGNGGLKIRTNSNNAYITEATSGKLAIQASNLEVSNTAADKNYIYCTDGAGVTLYHNGSNRFSTISSGVQLDGATHTIQNNTNSSSEDCQITVKTYSNAGSDPFIKFDAGGSDMIVGNHYGGTTNNKLKLGTGTNIAGTKGISIDGNGDIFIDGSSGAGDTQVTWDASANTLNFKDSVKTTWGTGGDLFIQHTSSGSGSDTIDSSAGYLYINTDALRLNSNTSGWNYLRADKSDGVLKLYKSNSEKLATSDTGISVTGEVASTQDYPIIKPLLDFNFTSSKKLDPRITYYRDGNASYVDENGLVVLVGDNEPRFDHDPITRESKGLLIEESRTNMFGGTADMHRAEVRWPVGGARGRRGDAVKAPDGTYTALQNVYNGGNGDLNIYYAPGNGASEMNTANDAVYTCSIWGKLSAGASYLTGFRIRTYNQNISVNYNLSTGVVVGNSENAGSDYISSAIEEYPDGWYRCSMTFRSGGDGNQGFQFYLLSGGNNGTLNSSSGAGESVSFWGAQMEAGSFATTFIPTFDRAVAQDADKSTRGADYAFITGQYFTDVYNVPEGTFVLTASVDDLTTSNQGMWGVEKSTNRGGFFNLLGYRVGGGASGHVGYWYNNNGSTSAFHNMNAGVTAGKSFTGAWAYKVNDMAASTDGMTVVADGTASIANDGEFDRFTIGSYHYDSVVSGHIQRAMYYPKWLPHSQVKTITS